MRLRESRANGSCSRSWHDGAGCGSQSRAMPRAMPSRGRSHRRGLAYLKNRRRNARTGAVRDRSTLGLSAHDDPSGASRRFPSFARTPGFFADAHRQPDAPEHSWGVWCRRSAGLTGPTRCEHCVVRRWPRLWRRARRSASWSRDLLWRQRIGAVRASTRQADRVYCRSGEEPECRAGPSTSLR